MVFFPVTQAFRVLPTQTVKYLRSCSMFMTIEDHARRICSDLALSPDQQTAIGRVLRDCASENLLLSKRELLCQYATNASCTRQSISTIGIVTRDRPMQLRVALESYLENCHKFGRDASFVVVDDSRDADVRDSCRRIVMSLSDGYKVPIQYCGLEEKIAYVTRLLDESNVPRAVIEFCILGDQLADFTGGANRNCLLLQTIGELIFSADDDTVCRFVQPERTEGSKGGVFGAEKDPTDLHVFSNRSVALASVAFVENDVLAMHEELLGQNLGALAARFSESGTLDLDQSCAHILRSLYLGEGTVVASYNGIFGDCGMYSAAGLLFHSGPTTRDRIVRSANDYSQALSCREVLRVAPVPTVSHGAPWLGFASGLDNRELLPPFVPIFRNEDGVFGTMIARCFANAFFGHLPYALAHLPVGERTYSVGHVEKATRVRFCELLLECVHPNSAPMATSKPSVNLREMGRAMSSLASLNIEEFEQFMRMRYWLYAGREITRMEALLTKENCNPDFWAADVRNYICALKQTLKEEILPLPCDLPRAANVIDGWRLFQCYIRKIGSLLQCWPDIVAAASLLSEKGIKPGRLLAG